MKNMVEIIGKLSPCQTYEDFKKIAGDFKLIGDGRFCEVFDIGDNKCLKISLQDLREVDQKISTNPLIAKYFPKIDYIHETGHAVICDIIKPEPSTEYYAKREKLKEDFKQAGIFIHDLISTNVFETNNELKVIDYGCLISEYES